MNYFWRLIAEGVLELLHGEFSLARISFAGARAMFRVLRKQSRIA